MEAPSTTHHQVYYTSSYRASLVGAAHNVLHCCRVVYGTAKQPEAAPAAILALGQHLPGT
jgi:hypothetical protein